jgi:ABC-type glycerol-3-phosphate transport system substrate-binding protein
MKRTSAVALAIGAVALLLAGCSGSNESTDANGLRKGTTGTSTSTTPTTSAKADGASGGPASQTTCGQFRALDSAAEKSAIEQMLAENPDSPFAGSPNVALGTAKLVCLAQSNADTTVVAAAGIVEKAK